jgi:hypothetical protein
MFSRKSVFSSVGRSAALVTAAALALTAIEPSMAFAGAAPSGKGLSATHGITDVSARRRVYHHRRVGGGGAAAAAAFAGIVGTGIAIAASRNRGYYNDGYYGGGPAYYGGPGYYGGGPYYGGYRRY